MTGSPALFPADLVPLETVDVPLANGKQVSVQSYRADFNPCPERSSMGLERTYAAKSLVLVEKQAMFPEIACLTLFQRCGWAGVWADQPHRKYFDKMPTQSKGTSLDTYINQLIARIAENNGKSKAGCWDLILWANRTVVFVDVTGSGPAAVELPEANARWLAASLRTGLSASQFAVVRWAYRSVVVKRRRGHGG